MKNLTIALTGNPNCGKSTVFNELTGLRQHVGNWPGKTVEKKEGSFKFKDVDFEVVDLPGTYSLTAYSQEEKIARDFIIEEQPDAVVSIVDAANLERNLYLTLQVLELGVPVILALNMMDQADRNQLKIDEAKLSTALGVPVVPMVAREGKGFDELKAALIGVAESGVAKKEVGSYTPALTAALGELTAVVNKDAELVKKFNPNWLATKLLEEDADILEKIGNKNVALLSKAGELRDSLSKDSEFTVETQLAEGRYGFIHGVVQSVLKKPAHKPETTSDKIDKVVTNRWLGIPIFLIMMWIVFKLTTDIAGNYLDWVDGVIGGPLTNWVTAIIGWISLDGSWFESLVVDGIIAGVGGVMVFVPVMMSLYLALAVLEDSGYMARAAFVMDRLMRALGLHGKSFMPMIVGFGCTVPAIYATRTLENDRDRILTGLLVPFMSCGARLPVYVLFASIFFPANASGVIFGLYVLGIVIAILLGLALKNTVFKTEEQSAFVMELPPYRMPTLKSLWASTWERTSHFVRKAWTLIMVTSIIIWALLAIPVTGEGSFADAPVDDSAFAAVSGVIAPIYNPAGFGSWEASGSIITGFVAKEVVVSTMAQAYDIEEAEEEAEPTTFLEDLLGIVTSFFTATWDAIRSIPLIVGIDVFEGEEEEEPIDLMAAVEQNFEESSGGRGKLASLGFMVFTLLYTPCMVAVAAARQEFGNKWMWVSVIGQFALAWVAAVAIFQIGSLF